jgi:hypothetical protein
LAQEADRAAQGPGHGRLRRSRQLRGP